MFVPGMLTVEVLGDRDRVRGDAGRRCTAPVVRVTHTVVDGEAVARAPCIANPQCELRIGSHPLEVRLRVVDVEALGDPVEAGEVPGGRVHGLRGRNASGDVERQRRKRHLTAAEDVVVVPHPGVGVLAAKLEVVRPLVQVQIVAGRHEVLRVPLRHPVHRTDRQTGEHQLGRRHVGDERDVGERVVLQSDLDFLHGRGTDHLRPGAEHVERALRRVRSLRRVRIARRLQVERVGVGRPGAANRQAVVRRQLVVHPQQQRLGELRVGDGGALPERLNGVVERQRRPLVLEREEVVELVLDDRSAERRAPLIVVVREHGLRHRVRGVQAVIAEEPVAAARYGVRTRLGDRLQLNAGRTTLRDVVQIRHDLVFGDRFAAELRLAKSLRRLVADSLAVEVHGPVVRVHARVARADDVGGHAWHHLREFEPVAAEQRHLLHLRRVDVASHLRGPRVHERRLAGDGQCLAERRDLHRDRDADVLSDQQHDLLLHDACEPAQLRLHFVVAGRELQHAVLAARIRDRDDLRAFRHVGHGDCHAGQHRLGLVGDGTDDGCLLRRGHAGQQRNKQEYSDRYRTDRTHVHGLLRQQIVGERTVKK